MSRAGGRGWWWGTRGDTAHREISFPALYGEKSISWGKPGGEMGDLPCEH